MKVKSGFEFMSRFLITMSVCLVSALSYAKSLPETEWTDFDKEYVLDAATDSLLIINEFSAVNSSVEFDLLPQNSSAQIGVLLRYANQNDWVYVACDKTVDAFGYVHWYVETPGSKMELARDIAKLYAHHKRRIKVNCIGRTVTVYVDGEQIGHKEIIDAALSDGKVGFRAYGEGCARISNVRCRKVMQQAMVPAKKSGFFTLTSMCMDVLLNKDFPSVQGYIWKKDNSRLSGQPFEVKTVSINGDIYKPMVSGKLVDNRVLYTLRVNEIDVEIKLCCEVKENVLQMRVTDIKEKGRFRVKTLAFPNHNLASVSHTVAGGCLSVANGVQSDSFFRLKEKPVDGTWQYGCILLLNSDKLVATLESNSIYSMRQFLYQSAQVGESVMTGIWGNEWIYRGHDGEVVDLPYIKVVLADDLNRDGKIDWQDGAVALQKEYPAPMGADIIRNSYATITMNFASFAPCPFLRQLDNIKKFYLATDGFGQMLELKGYQNEGHDSAHPDYSGNYNRRAGGLHDLAYLAKEARKYNAYIGVHINHSESYPEAKAFNDRIVTDIPAWRWLDQSYFINKEADMLDGTFEQRLNRLKADIPDLSFVYLDTYREFRWLACETARIFNRNGWAIWTEEDNVFDKEAIWTHYNPKAASLIHRFVHHQYRDGYASHPALLGGYSRGAELSFMGWQRGRDFYKVIKNFFTKQLPYRYLMHFPLLQLDSTRAVLEGGLIAVCDKEKGTLIRKDNVTLVSGDCVFIPWNPLTEEKIYHYNACGGKSVWTLPLSWKGVSEVYLYELTSQGRGLYKVLPVRNGTVEIDAQPLKGYVIYKQKMNPQPPMSWGDGGPVKDMGFDSRGFAVWTMRGDSSAFAIKETKFGQSYLEIKGKQPGEVYQVIKGLTPGKEYVASVWANAVGCKKAVLAVQCSAGLNEECYMQNNTVKNFYDTDRFNTTWHRMKVAFRMPDDGAEVVLKLQGSESNADSSVVCFDDVRLVECVSAKKAGYDYFEDFENVDEGWGPFIPSKMGSFMTHLSEKHDLYTDDTIHGNWSLKTVREKDGEVYRTSPALIRFVPGQAYEIEFDYKVDRAKVYKVVGKSKSTGRLVCSYELNRSGKCHLKFTTPVCDDFYIAIEKHGNAVLVIDDFGIKRRVQGDGDIDGRYITSCMFPEGATIGEKVRMAARVVPSERQLEWQKMEKTCFICYGINTFTDREWGTGKENPALFNPTGLDARQWARTAKEAGMKMILLTCKHHDGFCLWPSAYTDFSVKSSPWREGKGDLVREVADACKEFGLKFAVYLSPWDRNHPDYGTERYNDFFVNQLTELLTHYGRISEVWFDGACGEGPNGKRQEYDFRRYYELIRRLQPEAVIAVMGPDVRWVGTESGYGRDTEWSVLPASASSLSDIAESSQQAPGSGTFLPEGDKKAADLGSRKMLSDAKGMIWYPSEVDVSIRPGWYYHARQDSLVKSPQKLIDIYYSSVGKNSLLLLNLPPDKRGLIHENDIKSLREMTRILNDSFRKNLLKGARVVSGEAASLTDGVLKTFWQGKSTNDCLEITFRKKQRFDRLLLQENITEGQRIEEFALECWLDNEWKTVAQATTVGYKRILRFSPVETQKVRIVVRKSRDLPQIAEIGIYKASEEEN